MDEAYRTWIILLYQSTQLHAGATCFLIHQDVKVKRKVTEQQTLRLWEDSCGVRLYENGWSVGEIQYFNRSLDEYCMEINFSSYCNFFTQCTKLEIKLEDRKNW